MRKEGILVIGGLPDYQNKIEIGGATILMSNFAEYLKSNNISHKFLQTNKFNNLKTHKNNRIKSITYFFWMYFTHIWFYKRVFYNFSDHGVKIMYPFVLGLSKLLKQKVAFHKFGGSPEKLFSEVGNSKRDKIIKAFSKTDIIFLETKASVKILKDYLPSISHKIKWYPNVRQPFLGTIPAKKENSIIFLGHILDDKGIRELIEASKKLNKLGYKINIYGRIKQEEYKHFDFTAVGITYKGEIGGDKVLQILSQYKYLVLPSYFEGYPGVIIEALSVGVPVIASRVGGIPEMVSDGIEGKLIEPRNANAIFEAITSIDDISYKKMSKAALDKFNECFNSEIVNDSIVDIIMSM